jgi:DASS family divalent anion:Na+ symporter
LTISFLLGLFMTTQEISGRHANLWKWAVIFVCALAVYLLPRPVDVTPQAWRLLAIFLATIVGSILRPVPSAAVVLLGVTAIALTGALPLDQALKGYADPIVWLVLAAFFISRGLIKTGLGRRIALLFVRAIGSSSLGLGYALVGAEFVLASVVPSNGARSGGIIFPIAKSIAETYDSRPGETAERLGAFLMVLLYQSCVIICAIFLTGQASNALIAKFAKETAGVEITYAKWLLGAIAPGLVSLAVVPLLLYRLFPPAIKHTPQAAEFAREELAALGPMRRGEKLMTLVFLLVCGLWMTMGWHGLHYTTVALTGVAILFLTGVIDWQDALAERNGWDVFIWYGGLVRMAEALGETGLTKRFAQASAGFTSGWKWWLALGALLLIYFYAHYAFASITAHATAMYTPFLAVILAAGAPPVAAVLLLAYSSNLMASLTNYGTTPGPIYFGAGYVSQSAWWRLGFIVSLPNLLIWTFLGFAWWKLLGWW